MASQGTASGPDDSIAMGQLACIDQCDCHCRSKLCARDGIEGCWEREKGQRG